MFEQFRDYIDTERNREEKIIAISRDVTLKAKRCIASIHRFFIHILSCLKLMNDTFKVNMIPFIRFAARDFSLASQATLKKELNLIHETWAGLNDYIPNEQSAYKYHRQLTSAFQEYIEAIGFLTYCCHLHQVSFPFAAPATQGSSQSTVVESFPSYPLMKAIFASETNLKFNISIEDYLLGMADVTGEMMRLGILSASTGNWHFAQAIKESLRETLIAFENVEMYLTYGRTRNEMERKLQTMKASLKKMEETNYRISVLAAEHPKETVLKYLALKDDSLNQKDVSSSNE